MIDDSYKIDRKKPKDILSSYRYGSTKRAGDSNFEMQKTIDKLKFITKPSKATLFAHETARNTRKRLRRLSIITKRTAQKLTQIFLNKDWITGLAFKAEQIFEKGKEKKTAKKVAKDPNYKQSKKLKKEIRKTKLKLRKRQQSLTETRSKSRK
ncbi:hypothetical protein KAU11_03505 [Candidatus Babeliales bacterium]|nr:hypothetical protein [Candidatus Babeliales bacterium]